MDLSSVCADTGCFQSVDRLNGVSSSSSSNTSSRQAAEFSYPQMLLIVFLLHGGDGQDDRLCGLRSDLLHQCRRVSNLPTVWCCCCCHLWRRHHFQAITNVVVFTVGVATDVHWPAGWHLGQLGCGSRREGAVTGRDRWRSQSCFVYLPYTDINSTTWPQSWPLLRPSHSLHVACRTSPSKIEM